jgi:DNA mismatch endonuclease (patch repair protein)
LPGTPDVVLPGRKTAVFVNGCFWHGHDCRRGRLPTSNQEFWRVKIARNCQRDSEAIDRLADLGWRSFTIWECRLAADTAAVIESLFAIRD